MESTAIETIDLVRMIADGGMTVFAIYIVAVLWKDNKAKEERNQILSDRVLGVVEKNTESHTALVSAVVNNTNVVERVDNFIRDNGGNS